MDEFYITFQQEVLAINKMNVALQPVMDVWMPSTINIDEIYQCASTSILEETGFDAWFILICG